MRVHAFYPKISLLTPTDKWDAQKFTVQVDTRNHSSSSYVRRGAQGSPHYPPQSSAQDLEMIQQQSLQVCRKTPEQHCFPAKQPQILRKGRRSNPYLPFRQQHLITKAVIPNHLCFSTTQRGQRSTSILNKDHLL